MERINPALLTHTHPQQEINELATSMRKRGSGVGGIFKSVVRTSSSSPHINFKKVDFNIPLISIDSTALKARNKIIIRSIKNRLLF